MKRTAVNDAGHSPKRHKSNSRELSPDPFESSLRKNARDVYTNGTDDSGFLSGHAFMVWSSAGSAVRTVLMQVEDGDDGRIERFEIKLSGHCRKYFERLHFSPRDEFELSLKGAQLEKKQESSKPCYLPMALTFNKGVIIKFTKRPRKATENGLVIDTWKRMYYSIGGLLHSIVIPAWLVDIYFSVAEADRKRQAAAKVNEEADHSFWFTPPVQPPSDRLLSSLSMQVDPPDPLAQRHESNNSAIPDSSDHFPPPAEQRAHQSVPSSVPTNPIQPEKTSSGTTVNATSVERAKVGHSCAQEVSDRTVDNTSSVDSKPVHNALPDAPTNNDSETSTSSDYLEGRNNAGASATVQPQKSSPPQLTKKQQRLLKKAQRAAANAVSVSHESISAPVPGGSVQPASEPTIPTSANMPSSSNENMGESRDSSLDLRAGFFTEMVRLD
jgi:hypothetical protein